MASRAKLQLKPEKPAPVAKPAREESKAVAAPAKRQDREGTRMIGGHFPHATWAQLRRLAVDENRTTQELLGEALEDLFSKYAKA